MKIYLLIAAAKIQSRFLHEDGQDLIEYALIVALIAFSATAGMSSLASAVNSTFAQIGTTLSTYT